MVSVTIQLKLISPNGRKYKSDMLDSEAIIKIAKSIPNNRGADFIDWSNVDKKEYLETMRESVADSKKLKALLNSALTDKINDRDTFLKGIDYSYYYEEI